MASDLLMSCLAAASSNAAISSTVSRVASGQAPSRAALVASALEREMRRRAAQADARILAEHGASDDLDALVAWTSTHAELEG